VKVSVQREVGGRQLTITTGEWAKQASGAVTVQYGETVVFVAPQSGPPPPGIDFFPLTVDYRERAAAAGKFPGGFLKREGRPTLKEILTSRLVDRPVRPLFPEAYFDENLFSRLTVIVLDLSSGKPSVVGNSSLTTSCTTERSIVSSLLS